jgi:tetratricopeptide (TPR) repeat protein
MRRLFKELVFLWMFCFHSLVLVSQESSKIDSLERVLAQTGDSKIKIEVLISLSDEYSNIDISKSLLFAEQANNLAETDGGEKEKLKAYLNLSSNCYYRSDLPRAMELALKAKILAEDLSLDKELATALDAIGVIYYDIGNQTKSSEYIFASLKIVEKLQDKEGMGATYCQIGTLYLDQKDFDKAEDYYLKSLELAKNIKSNEGIASNLNNLAKVYYVKKDWHNALNRYQEALKINLEEGNSYLVASNYLNIANVFFDLKRYHEAISKIQQAGDIFEKIGNKLRLAKSHVMLSNIYFETGQQEQSKALAMNSLEIAQAEGYNEIVVNAAEILNKLYVEQKDSAMAYRYYVLENQYKDSLFLAEKQKTLIKLELQYQFEKNEQELKIAKQRRNVVILIISGALFFCVIIILLIWNQLRLRAKKHQVEQAKYEQELEFKNKEMVLNVMSLMKKNEMLAELSEKIVAIEKESSSPESRETIKKIAVELQKSQADEIWKEFSVRFKEVHGEFYNHLLQKFPSLSPNELKLCAFLRLNMSTKDISELTGQRVSTLETARYRLRQKLGIANSDTNLVTFLSSL